MVDEESSPVVCNLFSCEHESSWQCDNCRKNLCNSCYAEWKKQQQQTFTCPFCRNIVNRRSKIVPLSVIEIVHDEDSDLFSFPPPVIQTSLEPPHDPWRKCTDTLCFEPRNRRCCTIMVTWTLCNILSSFFIFLFLGGDDGPLSIFECVLICLLFFSLILHCNFRFECVRMH